MTPHAAEELVEPDKQRGQADLSGMVMSRGVPPLVVSSGDRLTYLRLLAPLGEDPGVRSASCSADFSPSTLWSYQPASGRPSTRLHSQRHHPSAR